MSLLSTFKRLPARRRRKLKQLILLGYSYIRHMRNNSHPVRRWWVHPEIERRATQGGFLNLIERYKTLHPDSYFGALRITPEQFDVLLSHVERDITKETTNMREPIDAPQRLSLTLMYLASGDSIKLLSMFFRLGESTVRGIIRDTCKALWENLNDVYVKMPSTTTEWKRISEQFAAQWNFPNCIGTLDGKHCAIRAPNNTGTEFFNYKKHFSIVLLATCDAQYRFLYVNVGTSGRWSDGGTYDYSSLADALNGCTVNIPEDSLLPNTNQKVPYVLLGDEAFPLKSYMMRPFPGRSIDSQEKTVYNYRLSRARRTIENVFGIMCARWRCMLTTLHMAPSTAESIVLACCVLHNFMRTEAMKEYTPPGYADTIDPTCGLIIDGQWRTHAPPAPRPKTNATRTLDGQQVQNEFVKYFNSPEGTVSWQIPYVNRT